MHRVDNQSLQRLRPEERAAMKDFWAIYEPIAVSVDEEVRKACEEIPEFAPVIRAMTVEQMAQQGARSRTLQSGAILRDNWGPYLADIREQGKQYALMGITFGAWFEVVAAFRSVVHDRIASLARENPQRAERAAVGLNRFLDIAMAGIGEAYVEAKEDVIRRQQEAIRELSTPVLQLRERLLIIPMVGLLDTERARQLTDALLRSIRERRARSVVMDVTGVPVVDSKVANHLLSTVAAARLMGARVIVSGLSAEVAQSLAALGVDLAQVNTVGDLQTAVEEAERYLAGG